MVRGVGNSIGSPVPLLARRTRQQWAGLYILFLGAISFGTLGWLAYLQGASSFLVPPGPFSWFGFLLLLAVAVFAERYTIRLGSGMEVSASFLAIFLTAAIAGPLASFVTAAASQVQLVRRGQIERALCFSSAIAIVSGGTALSYWQLLGFFGGPERASPIIVAAMGLAAGLLFQVLNFVIFLPIGLLRHRKGPMTAFRQGFLPFLPFHFFFLAISLGLIYIYQLYAVRNPNASSVYSTLLIMLCLLPVLGLIYAFRAYANQMTLAKHNERLALRNERLALQAVASQVTALDLKDNYTARHSAAVARWAVDIAESLKLSKQEVNVTHLAGLLHDVGKIGVPDEVLNCPGRLDQVSWAMMETHSQNGQKILTNIDQFDEVATVVLYHHERYDGTGYPHHITGETIPLISRIIGVADSYSAMVSDRPYRKGLALEVAKEELIKNRGIQFDPGVVDCFLEVLEAHDESYRRGLEADFHVEFQKVKFLRELPPEDGEIEDAPGRAARKQAGTAGAAA